MRFLNLNLFCLFLSSIIGVIVFCYYFDLNLIDPENINWILKGGGDSLQNYLGSYAFRTDAWHFPITKTTILNAPEGVSIIYTDSNPLLSIIAKIFKGVFPPKYQLFGMWIFLCFVLQSVFGYLIVRKLTYNYCYSLLGGLLFCLLPTLIFRVGHMNLICFWIILWTLYVFLDEKIQSSRKEVYFFGLLFLSATIHAYFTFIILIIGMSWYFKKLIGLISENKKKDLIRFFAANAAYSIAFILLLWVLGYFYNQPKHEGLLGFGSYSMNLNATFNPMFGEFSNYLNPLPFNGGQYEGFQYWGIGIIALVIFSAILGLKQYVNSVNSIIIWGLLLLSLLFFIKPDEISYFERGMLVCFFISSSSIFFSATTDKNFDLGWLLWPAIISFLLALSNEIFLGNTLLFRYSVSSNAFYSEFLRSIRSSGRIFWATTHIILLLCLYLIYKFNSPKQSIAFLLSFIALQMMDLTKLKYRIDSVNHDYISPLSVENQKIISKASSVNFLYSVDLRIAEYAVLNGIKINNFYTVHDLGQMTLKKIDGLVEDLKVGKIDPTKLYLFRISELPAETIFPVYHFCNDYLAIPPKDYVQNIPTSANVKKIVSDSMSTISSQIQNSPLTIIAVRDEAAAQMPNAFKEFMEAKFKSQIKNLGNRQSYIAVFSNGALITEIIGTDKAVEYSGVLSNMNIYVKSAGAEFGDNSIIRINDINYSINWRGLNVVSLVDTNKVLFNISHYDTHERAYPF